MRLLKNIIKLIFLHSLSDGALQTNYMAMYKSPTSIHPTNGIVWPSVLTCHALVNGSLVWLITGNVWFGIVDAGFHFTIDYYSSLQYLTHLQDQSLHLLTKIGVAYLWLRQSKESRCSC